MSNKFIEFFKEPPFAEPIQDEEKVKKCTHIFAGEFFIPVLSHT